MPKKLNKLMKTTRKPALLATEGTDSSPAEELMEPSTTRGSQSDSATSRPQTGRQVSPKAVARAIERDHENLAKLRNNFDDVYTKFKGKRAVSQV